MSQEYSSRRQRRNNRARTGRPVLVTSSDTTNNTPVSEEQSTTSTATDVVEPEPLPVPTPAPTTGQRRLPRFFSNVSKSEETTVSSTNDQTVAQARIARATRGKTASVPAVKATNEPNEKTTTKPATQAAQTTPRPATNRPSAQQGFFKTRYIIGLGIYLLVADFVGVYEAQLLTQLKLERQLAAFNLFGLPIQLRTSTIVFLATLVIVLVLLAYFDLLPRSLGAARNTGSGTGRSTTSNTPTERTPQPTMRQGVKGSDDDLYQAYRSNQRRDKKR